VSQRTLFISIAGFELRKRRRMLSSYVYFVVLFACGWLSMLATGGAFSSVSVATGSDKVYANAPEVLHAFVAMLSHFGVFISAAVFGQALHQDVEAGLGPLIFTTGVGKRSYLAGRYLGALAFALLLFTSIALGLWVGTLMPFLDRSLFGINRISYYAWPFLVSVAPNVLFTGAIFFSLAALLRSMTPVYVGATLLVIGYLMTQALFTDPDQRSLAALIDPLGFRATDLATRYWTAAERNTNLIPLEGVLLENRLLWLGVGLGLLAFTFWRFGFDTIGAGVAPAGRGARAAEGREPSPGGDTSAASGATPLSAALQPRRVSTAPRSASGHAALLLRLTWLDFRETVHSIYFGVMLLAGVLFLGMMAQQLDSLFGTPTYPVTRAIVEVVGASFTPFALIIIAFYAGELTFRERDARIDGLMDALPVPTWLPFASKLACLLLIPVVLELVVLCSGLVIQASQGYFHHELGLYLRALFGLSFVDYAQLCALCLAVHGVLQHKYLGHFVIVLFYMSLGFMSKLGLEHNLSIFGGTPDHPYSDMNGYGHLLRGVRWFQAYWSAAAVLLCVAAYLGWQRGSDTTLRARWREAHARWSWPLRATTAAAFVAFAGVGGYIYYNTNGLNRYESSHDREQKKAEYEQRYKPLATLPQPRVTDVAVEIDIFPDTDPPSLRARGTFRLKNQSRSRVERVLVNLDPGFPLGELRIGNVSEPSARDPRLGVYLFDLARPLEPGDTDELRFDLPFRPQGFPNGRPWTRVVHNGTFFQSQYLPTLGYQTERELEFDNERKKYGLAPKAGLPPADDLAARQNNYVVNDADWVSFQAEVSTSLDQIALAPGYLQREWVEGTRRHFRYAMDNPILRYFSALSARYQVKRDQWNGVALEIYHHPGHEFDLDRMMQGMKDTLAYCTSQFGPYQHRQVRIIEFPGYEQFAEAFPNTIPYSEAIGFIAKVDPDDPKDVDYPYYVTAHEVAHQWWAHQAISGPVQGATMLSESMAQYTALMVMKAAFGPQKMKRFLRFELDRYLQGRGLERKKEVPLARVEQQAYIYYNKGSLAFYALQDYIGEERVNRAARTFLEAVKFQQPPYTAAPELLGHLRRETPPELAYLLDDLFENITLFKNRAKSATYQKQPDGRYALKLELFAQKVRADELGVEHEVPLGDLIEVGAVDADGVAVALEKHWIRAADTELTLLLDAPPVRAGIDPLNKLVDRNPDDNVVPAVEAAVPP
jgi:ABC-2 type transport system permease protein